MSEAVDVVSAEINGPEPSVDSSAETKAQSPKQKSHQRWFSRAHAPNTAVEQSFAPVTLKRGEIVHGASAEASSEVTISSETVGKYSNFLESYVRNLGKLAEIPDTAGSGKTMFDVISADPQFAHDKLLMDMLGTQVVGMDGKTITRSVNETKVAEFLKGENGWAITTQLMEQYALLTELGLGMDATVKSLYNKRQKPDKQTRSDTIHRHKTLPYGARVGLGKAFSGLKVAGFFAGMPGATKLQYETDGDLINELKANATPAQAEYIKAMIGVDVNKINVTRIPYRPGSGRDYGLEFTYDSDVKPDLNTLLDENNSILGAREAFLSEVGIDPKKVRTPEEFIVNDKAQPETLSLRYYKEIMDEFAKLGLDGAPKYDRLQGMAKARRNVLVRYSERQVALEQAGQGEKSITALEDKSKIMREHPDQLAAKRKEKAQKAKDAASKAKETVDGKKRELVDPLPDLDAQVAVLQTELARDFGVAFPPNVDFATAVKDHIEKLRKEVDKREKALTDKTSEKGKAILTELGKVNDKIGESTDAIKALTTAIATSGGDIKGGINIAPPSYNVTELREAVGMQYDGEIASLQRQLDRAEQEVSDMEQKAAEYLGAVSERQGAILQIAGREPGQLQASEQAYADFSPPGATPLATDAELRSMPVKDLAARLTTGTDEEKLQTAILAKAEATAKRDESVRPIPNFQLDALTVLTDPSTGLSRDDIVIRSIEDIQNAMTASGSPLTPDEVKDKAIAAKAAAERMLRSRYAIRLNQESAHYETIIKEQDDELKKSVDFNDKAAEIDLAVAIMKNEEDIFTRSNAMQGTPDADKLTSTTLVDDKDLTLSEAERNSKEQEWYVAMFHHLYPQAREATNRNELFEMFKRSVSSAELTAVLAKAPNTSIQQDMKYVINYLRDRALAA